MQRPVLILSGPTACGKSAAGVELGLLLGQKGVPAAVVNFDSLLFYRELNIGTAKPTAAEQKGVPHYLIDVRSAADPMTAADFRTLAEEVIDRLHAQGTIPILVGGSGFYLRALIKGMYEGVALSGPKSLEAQGILAAEGGDGLKRRLAQIDPESAARLHVNDHYRLARAYEYWLANGIPISKARAGMQELSPYDFSITARPDWALFHAYLDMPKDAHWQRIQARTRAMLAAGVLEEVAQLLISGLTGKERPLNAIGYREAQKYLRGELATPEDYAREVDVATRQLAKSQRTFFKKVTGKTEYNSLEGTAQLFQDALRFLGAWSDNRYMDITESGGNRRLKIVIISDGTGETATAVARAVMTQFKDKDVYFTRYKNVRTTEQIDSIFTEAAIHHDLVIYTIVKRELRQHVQERARTQHVRVLDILGPALTAFSNYFEQEPSSVPGLLHAVNDDYFKRVAAMEFTLNHDDGRNLESLHLADVVLVGVSRTSKTPLSVYLSQHGLKVTNVPMILGAPLPKALFEIDQRKIFALTIDPQALLEIRKKRLDVLGSRQLGDYADESKIVQEIEWANSVFKENKRWPVFNVTGRALEDIAAEIMKLLSMRSNNMFKQGIGKRTGP